MVFAANRVFFGGSSFSPQEAQYLRAAISRGFTRDETRQFMRQNFNRGVSNAAIAEARRAYEQSALAGARSRLLAGEQRLERGIFEPVLVRQASSRVVIGTTVRVRVARTGAVIDRVVRIGFDDIPSEAELQARIRDVINRGHTGESAVSIEDEYDDPESGRVRRVTLQEEA